MRRWAITLAVLGGLVAVLVAVVRKLNQVLDAATEDETDDDLFLYEEAPLLPEPLGTKVDEALAEANHEGWVIRGRPERKQAEE